MSLKSLLVPEVIETFHSDFNGEIKLELFLRALRLEVGGLTQSGDVMVWVWSAGIKNIFPRDYSPESILLLGLGGGSALFWLRKRYPKAHLTAVEIDPVMIDIARRHFHVDRINNLDIINADAVEFVKAANPSVGRWSLMLMDCYQGFKTPPGFDDLSVLKKMKKVADSVLINRLYWDQHKTVSDEFVQKISPHFQIKSVYTASNLIISLK